MGEIKSHVYDDYEEDIDYKETFSLVSSKDSFKIIIALVPYSNLELHQMDVKTIILNGDIDEIIYIVQAKKLYVKRPKESRFQI